MQKSESIVELACALAQAQGELQPVKMNSVNPFLKNKYADLGAVIFTSRPVLAKFGLSVSQLVYTESGEIGIETILIHKSGEWLSSRMGLPLGDEKGKSQAQVAGSVITYLRRYSLASILGMYADEDSDGQHQQPKPAQPIASSKQMTPAQANTPPGNITPKMMVDEGLSESVAAAAEVLNNLKVAGKPAAEFWGRVVLYRKWRSTGMVNAEAYVKAIAGEVPPAVSDQYDPEDDAKIDDEGAK